MDILRPNVIDINGRHYRRLFWPSSQADERNRDKPEEKVDSGRMEPTDCRLKDYVLTFLRHFLVEEELAWEDDDGVRQTEDGFCMALPIPDVFHKHINGRKGDTKRRLESDTGAKIRLPHIGQSGDVGNHHQCNNGFNNYYYYL